MILLRSTLSGRSPSTPSVVSRSPSAPSSHNTSSTRSPPSGRAVSPQPSSTATCASLSFATCAIPDGTLYSLPYLFTSESYPSKAAGSIKYMTLKNRIESFDALTAKEREDRVLSLMNRLDPLLLDSPIRNIIAQKKSFRLTDTSILIVSLPKRQNYDLLAALAMSRWRGRTYVERPHLHVGASVPIVACRYLSEMQDQFRERMLGNATIITFRTGGREP